MKRFFHAIKTLYTLGTLHTSLWFMGLKFSWSKASFTNLAKRAYANPYAARGLRLISQNMAAVPLVVKMGDDVKSEHELLSLLERPNPRTTWQMFCDMMVAHIYCGGELFVEKRSPVTGSSAGKPKRLYLWQPDRFSDFVIRGEHPEGFLERLSPESMKMTADGDIIGYVFLDRKGTPVSFTIDQMLHVRIYNPNDPERGMPILLAAHRQLETMEAADDWNRSIASGGGRIPGYWTPNGLPPGEQLTPDQVETAQEAIDKLRKKGQAESKEIVMSGAFDLVKNAITPKDADWLEGYKNNARAVGALMGVDPSLLGDVKSGSLTDAGTNAALRSLLLLTILPLLDFFLAELTAWLEPYYPGAEIAYNDDDIDVLAWDRAEKIRTLTLAAGGPVITRNEARADLGKKQLEGDPSYDQVLVPLGVSTAVREPMRRIDTRTKSSAAFSRLVGLVAEPEAA